MSLTNEPASVRSTTTPASKFQLVAELGRGGMATVYLAVIRGPAGFNKLVVLKFLRPSLAAEQEFLEMFLAEARLAARINHPNVVQTNEIGFDERGLYYIAMEHVDGLSLEMVARKAGAAFPAALQIHVIVQALHGLHHAHELSDFDGGALCVVHRDVSPHNIMVSYDGHVKLLDFGIAKAADSSGNTRTGILKGKCAYMAPEQFGGHDVDRRADVFAAGVILWQALAGRKLWQGLSDAEIFARLSRGEILTPLAVKPDLPAELVDICLRALAPQRNDRFATAADFATTLEQATRHIDGYHATSRELAAFLQQTFAAERAEVRRKVEDQLREATRVGGDLVKVAPQAAEPTRPRESPIPKVALIALTLFALGSAAVVAMGLRSRPVDGPSGMLSGSGGAQSRVAIHAFPESAKVYFDDAPLSGNPATVSLQRDGLAHRIRAEAPGRSRKTELVVLDSATLSVELELDVEDELVDPFGNKLTQVTFKALPASARLFVDDVLLPTNPSIAKLPRDGREHLLRADAWGFLSKSERVRFDGARLPVTWALDPAPVAAVVKRAALPAAPGRPAVEETTTPPPPLGVTVAALPLPTTKKSLDREDPWTAKPR